MKLPYPANNGCCLLLVEGALRVAVNRIEDLEQHNAYSDHVTWTVCCSCCCCSCCCCGFCCGGRGGCCGGCCGGRGGEVQDQSI